MSDDSKPPQPPQKPTAKTSTVPLKKETVRITLKAKPGTGTPGAPAPTGATPPAPPSGGAPRPPAAAPAPPAPPKPVAPKTVPLSTGAPRPPAGAKTVPLTPTPPAAPGARVAQPTAKIGGVPAPAAPGAKPLPKATVQLQATQPMAARPTAQIQTGGLKTGAIRSAPASQLLEDEEEETGIMPFAIIALVIAIAVLCIELFSSPKYMPSALPAEKNPFEKKLDDGRYIPNFDTKLPPIQKGHES